MIRPVRLRKNRIMYSSCSLSCPHKFSFMWLIRQNKHSWSKRPQLMSQADYQAQIVPAGIRRSWWFLNRLGVIHTWLLWHDLYWERKELKGSSHCRALSKRKTNSFLMPNLFFYSSAFLLTSKLPKLHAGWDHVSDLNLNAPTWVNCFAVSHTESGLNFPQVQQSNLRKQLSQTLAINLGCNASTSNEPQGGIKWQILLSQIRLRLHGLQRGNLPISNKSKMKLHIWQRTKTHSTVQMPQFKNACVNISISHRSRKQ